MMPLEQGRVGMLRQSETWDRKISFIPDTHELLTVFREPRKGHRYAIGVDTAEGILDSMGKDPDASVITVLDLDAGGQQVAVYAGQVAEEFLVAPLLIIATWYNLAYCVIESNSTGKHVAIEMGKLYDGARLYHRMDEQGHHAKSKSVGWRTTVGNRNILISTLATAIEETAITILDERTLKECKRFERKAGGRCEAADSFHDDQVMALGLAVVGLECYPAAIETASREARMRTRQFIQRRQSRGTANKTTGY
jgi:hypothetical protein